MLKGDVNSCCIFALELDYLYKNLFFFNFLNIFTPQATFYTSCISLQEWFKSIGCCQLFASPRHPCSNGQAESTGKLLFQRQQFTWRICRTFQHSMLSSITFLSDTVIQFTHRLKRKDSCDALQKSQFTLFFESRHNRQHFLLR